MSEHAVKKGNLWPVSVVLGLELLFLIYAWGLDDHIRQIKIFYTIFSFGVTGLLLLTYLLFFSGMKWKMRVGAFAIIVGSVALFFTLFEMTEVTGDVLPVFHWRWASRHLTGTMNPDVAGAMHRALKDDSEPHLDYPQFLGPTRTAVLADVTLETDWQVHPPRLLWNQPIGEGWSAFAVQGNLALTQEQRGGDELVTCYNLTTGELIWVHRYRARYDNPLAGIGPRATPTVDGDRVATLGATGVLNMLDLNTGRLIWRVHILEDNHAKMTEWGISGSPLLTDSLVIVSAGGPDGRSLVAYHRDTGTRVWSGGDDPAGYSSPMVATLCGMPQILIFTYHHIVGHAPDNGQVLWRFPWPGDTQKVAQPLLLAGNRVFMSSGYGVGSKLFRVTQHEDGTYSTAFLWKSTRLKAKFTNPVFYNGAIFGLDDGILVSLDPQTGKRNWKRGRYGHGQLMLVDSTLLVVTEQGDVVLVQANAERHRELARIPVLNGKTWNNPAFAAPYLLVRNAQEAACLKLALKTDTEL